MPTMMRTIVRPLVTEKTSAAYQDRGEYTFEVHPDATKTTIKAAIESLFGVKVTFSVCVPALSRSPSAWSYTALPETDADAFSWAELNDVPKVMATGVLHASPEVAWVMSAVAKEIGRAHV